MIKKTRNVLASSALMSLVLSVSLNVTNVNAKEVGQVNRFGGDTRFNTAEEVAKNLFKTSENVVIVNGLGYADAVSAAPFAKQLDAPILLTKGKEAEAELLQTLKELGAKNLYVIGGEGVVSSNVLNALKDYRVERIGGNTRYETNAQIAKRVLANSNTKGAILVNAEDGYADSLSAASIAAKKGYAILFANSREVPKAVLDVAKGLEVIAVGGQKVLPDAVVQSVSGKRVTEKASNRFETNLSLLNYFKSDLSFDNIFVASGGSDSTSEFADSLVASAAAAKFGAPLVLSGLGASEDNRNLALEYIKANVKNTSKVSLIGSTGVISSDIEQSIKKVLSDKVSKPSSSSSSSSSSGGNSSSGSNSGSTTSSAVSIDNLNTAGNYTGDAAISSISTASVFGPQTGTTVLNGNLNISVPSAVDGQNIKLRNLDIKGNITVDFGSGNVEFENVKVNGVEVTNIGQNSLHIKGDTYIGVLNIKDIDSNAHIVIESNSASIEDTNINSGAKLELGSDVNSINPFGTIKISPAKDGDTVVLSGTYGSVEVEKGVKLQIAPGAKILGNLVVKSGADISLGDSAVVKKLDISSENESDKIVLNGNFTSIEINKKANVEIQSGNSNIVSNVQTDVNVTTGASITVRGDAGNITNKGEGSSQVNSNPSRDNKVEAILINGASVQYNCEIKDVTGGIKVSKFLQNLQLSDFATAWVEFNNAKLSDDDYLCERCNLIVQAENGDKKYYGVGLARDNSHGSIKVQYDGFKDTNLEENKLSGILNFSVLDSEENVQGYYVTVQQRMYQGAFITSKPIVVKYVPFNKDSNKKYSINIDNLNISGSKDLRMMVGAVYKNRTLIPQMNEDWNLIDLPKNVLKPSSDGITISFTDTNNEKGKIAGTINFKKSTDESNVKYYELQLSKSYEVGGRDTGTYYQLGYVAAQGQNQYTYEINNGRTDYMDLQNAKRISIVITPLNEYGEPADQISGEIKDIGSDDNSELKVPVLKASENTTTSAITVENLDIDTEVRLYVYDPGMDKFVPYMRDGEQVVLQQHGGESAFYNLEPGRYKAAQYINGKEGKMSEEAVLKPVKLYAVVQGTTVMFPNAQIGTLSLYDENKQYINGIGVNRAGEAKFENLAPGKYFVNQYINKIDGDYTEFEIPQN